MICFKEVIIDKAIKALLIFVERKSNNAVNAKILITNNEINAILFLIDR